MTKKSQTPEKEEVVTEQVAEAPAATEAAPEPDVVADPNPIDPPAQGVAAPRMVATKYGGPMVCLSTGTVYDGAPRDAVECGWLQDQLDAGTMYEVKPE